MKLSLFFTLIVVTTLFSCKSAPSEGSLQDGAFKNKRFGWTLEIPEGWHTITNLEQDLLKKQGHKATTEAFDDRAIDNWTQILHLNKGLDMNRLIVSYLKYQP